MYAVLSDIHGNMYAFREILKDMEKHNREIKLERVGRFIVAGLSLGLAVYVMIKVGSMLPH